MATEEELSRLEKAGELAKKILENKKEISKLNAEELNTLELVNTLVNTTAESQRKALETLQEKLKNQKERFSIDNKLTESEMARLNRTGEEIKNQKKLIEIQKSAHIKKLQNEQELKQKISERLADERVKKAAQAAADLKVLEKQGLSIRNLTLQREKQLSIMGAINGAIEMTMATSNLMTRLVANSVDILTAKLFGFNISLGNVLTATKQLPTDIEKAVAGMAASTGLSLDALQTNIVAAFDPSGASVGIENMRAHIKMLSAELGEDAFEAGFFERVLSLGEIDQSFRALIQNAAVFRQGFLDSQPATAAYTTNLIAGLGRLGVAQGDSAEIFDVFNKAMADSPVGAGKSLRSLASISKSLGIEFSKSFTNFRAVMNPLSQFGDRMTDVFAKLQARAAASGTELSKLANIASGMDTFEGAAKAAQTLNGILGDTFINVTDLALADPNEKIKMITDAIKDSGVEFDDLNRQYKNIIATAAGFDSVQEFQRQIFNEEAINKATGALNTNAMAQQDLNARIIASLDITERQRRGISATGAAAATGIASARAAADTYRDVTAQLYKDVLEITGDPQAAFLMQQLGLGAGAKAGELLDKGANKLLGGFKLDDKQIGRIDAALGTFAAGAAVYTAGTAVSGGVQDVLKSGAPGKLPKVQPVGGPQASASSAIEVTKMVMVEIDPDANTGLAKLVMRVVPKALAGMTGRAMT